MLKRLRIQNLILVEQADILFATGFNVLTGETGAGKSAIMNSLSLALGERSDSSMIRRGCDKGIIEAIFDIGHLPEIAHLLDKAGIDHEMDDDLLIRREIHTSGKNRLFINNQLAQLAVLKSIGSHLGLIVSQHANQQLFILDYHRHVVDTFGNLNTLSQEFKESFENEKALRDELEKIKQEAAERCRKMDSYRYEIEEISEANLKETEDEELFSEYSLLSNSHDLSEKIETVNQLLSGEEKPVIHRLKSCKTQLDAIVQMDPNLKETAESLHNAIIELQEVSHTLLRYAGNIQHDPERMTKIDERLTVINKLKRKYGNSVNEINSYRGDIEKKLEQLENADQRIEQLETLLVTAEAQANRLAGELTSHRQKTVKLLELAVSQKLHSLNMKGSQFIIKMEKQKRSIQGDDKIEFFLKPNIGEQEIALRDAASGGEMARVLLSLLTLLAGKEKIALLIFDEIDANIGGETAAIVGGQLNEIGKQHQVICVTHFPQVASQADHHLHILKTEREGRTVTQVNELDVAGQEKELERMVGKK